MKRKFTIFLIIVAVLAGAAGFYYYQKNIYSKDGLKLEILGPETADLLGEVDYIVKYKNNGNTRLDQPELVFEYPENSIPNEGGSQRATLGSKDLGEAIYPGQEKTLHFKGRLLGRENQAMLVKASLTYHPKNLRARYESATTFTTVIKKVGLTLEFDLPSKIESGKELGFSLNYFSNTDYPLSNLRIQIGYPSDFEFINSSPVALGNTDWELGLLNKAEGGRIEVAGKVSGEVGEEKIFQAELGSWQDGEFILLKTVAKGVEIVQPNIHITQQINGNPQYIASPGDQLHYEILFKNIGDSALTNLFLVSRLEGQAFDFQTLRSANGDFESGDNSLVFDWRRVPRLQFLNPQEEGRVEFWVELKEDWDIGSSENKETVIKNKIFLSQAREEFTTKVNSKLTISQKGYFQDEIFGNSGSLPPKVGQTTTYTIMWQVKNYYSKVSNAKMKVILPRESRLTGKIFPEEEEEKFTFDSQSREIVWNIGDLEVGQGVLGPAPNVAFQIAFTPGSSQRGSVPDLIREARVTGLDQWTGDILEATSPAINTSLPDDQTVTGQMGVVQ